MAKYNIKLIGYPDFYTSKDSRKLIDFNKDFWFYLFNKENTKDLIDYKILSYNEILELKYILPNLELSYKLFKLIRYKDIGIQNILFSFNLLDKYLKILLKSNGGIIIKLFSYFKIEDNVYLNIEDTIFYKFIYKQYNSLFQKLSKGDIINISIRLSEQIVQIYIINYILNQKNKNDIQINIDLGNLIEFEDREEFKKKLKFKISQKINFEKQKNKEYNNFYYKKIFGEKYKPYSFFNKGCYWNKCIFCNIGENKKLFVQKKYNIKEIIGNIINNNIKYIHIIDPSITLRELLYLSKEIIKSKINVKIHTRTRFTDKFNETNCKILAQAGVRFMGIGLESVSTRLNNLINKYNKDYTEKDFNKLIGICEKVGIKLHYYTIFGLPTETKKEIDKTYDFLKTNLYKYSFFSYTAGFLGLNKGTEIYNNPDKYGISFSEKKLGGEIFIEDYKERNFQENFNYTSKKLNNLKKNLFIGNLASKIDFYNFWYFIEHSNIFHVQKMKYDKNPYFEYFSKNNIVNSNNLLDYKYKKNKFIQYIKEEDKIFVKNWVLLVEKEIDLDILRLLQNYNDKISLRDNWINTIGKEIKKMNLDILYDLIKNYYLIINY